MAFENKTIGEIRDLLLNALQAKFNRTFRLLPKAFLRTLATVLAGVFVILHKQIGWLFLQLFPDTAYFGEVDILGRKVRPLIKWGTLVGVGDPKPATPWRGAATVTATAPGTVLLAGATLKSPLTGKIYLTEKSVRFTHTREAVPLVCAESGQAGDLTAGDTLTFVSPPGNVDKNAAVSGVTAYGAPDESESDYRTRVSGRFRAPPQGGALADYRSWTLDVSGVLNAYPYQDPDSPASVLVYIAGAPPAYPDRVPDAALLRQAAAAIAPLKPLCAVVDPDNNGAFRNIRPVSILAFGIRIEGLSAADLDITRNALTAVLDEYFLSREPYIHGLSDENAKTHTVTRVAVIRIIDQTLTAFDLTFASVALTYAETIPRRSPCRPLESSPWVWASLPDSTRLPPSYRRLYEVL